MTTNNDDAAKTTAADAGVARRSVLRAAALAGTAVAATSVLAACAGGNEGSEGNGGGASDGMGSSDGMGGSTESSPGATADGGATIVATTDVPVGGGVINQDAKVVVTQPAQGEFKAFDAMCTHKQCPVTNVEDGTINCQCHGSRFSIEDGSVKGGPATEPLGSVDVKVDGESIVRA